MTTIDISTAEYELSHGRAPRGRGTWAFEARGPDGRLGRIWTPPLSFTDAVAWAQRRAREKHGADAVFELLVLP